MVMSDDSGGRNGHERMILAQRQRVQEARSHFIGEGVHGDYTETAHLELARVCVEYYQILREYDGEAVIDGLPDITELRDRLGSKKQMLSQSPGLKRGEGYEPRPAVLEVPVDDILDLLEQLDDVANGLGFSAAAAETVPKNEADESDLKGLLETRGQDDAIENLPSEEEAGS